MNILKDILFYLKHKKEINRYYGYGLKEGYIRDENLEWKSRLDIYRRME